MARSAADEPIERFRFIVTFFAGQGILSGNSNNSSQFSDTDDPDLNNTGFSEVLLPRAIVKQILYRENIDGPKTMKIAGLTSYEPITLKRGVTKDRRLYSWMKEVNNDVGSLNNFMGALAGLSFVPFQNPVYRKDIVISVMDRAGNFTKHWLLFNAWPVGYKPGNDLDSQANEKLVQELSVTFESFFEVIAPNVGEALQKIQLEAEIAAQQAAAAGLIGAFTGLFGQ